MTTNIAVLVGSLRADSINRRLAEALRDNPGSDVELTIVDGLAEVPFYNEELDADSAPEQAVALRSAVAAADRVLIVTPEYNGTMPAVLNNAIDWLSRPYGQGAVVGKPVAVVGVTPTPYGGKWSHDDAVRSVGIAGAVAVPETTISQTAIDVDVFSDEVLDRFRGTIAALVAHTPELVTA